MTWKMIDDGKGSGIKTWQRQVGGGYLYLTQNDSGQVAQSFACDWAKLIGDIVRDLPVNFVDVKNRVKSVEASNFQNGIYDADVVPPGFKKSKRRRNEPMGITDLPDFLPEDMI